MKPAKKTEVTKKNLTAVPSAPKAAEQTKAVAKLDKAQPPAEYTGPAWGMEGVEVEDNIIPKLLLMQGQSDAVNEGSAEIGDLIDSLTLEVMGKEGEPIEIIPICTNKTWIVSKKELVKGKLAPKFQFVEQIPMTAENKDRSQDEMEYEEEDGSITRYDRSLNFFVLNANNIDGLPYQISFRRTSYMAGRKIVTHFSTMNMQKKPPAARTLTLGSKAMSNEHGNFSVFEIGSGRPTTADEIAKAYSWYKTIMAGKVKLHEADSEPVEGAQATEDDARGAAKY